MRRYIQRLAGKMMNKTLAGAFERWAEFVEEAVEMRVKMNRVLKKLLNKQLAGRSLHSSLLSST